MLVKKVILTLIFAGIYSVSNAQDLNALDDNNGFQNYKFGMHMNQFQNCNFETVENGGAERCIIRRTHLIGDIEAIDVVLFFVNSKLSKIKVNFDTKFSGQLREAVRSAFGASTNNNIPNNPMQYNPHSTTRFIWAAENIKLVYSHSPRSDLYLEYSLNNYDELRRIYRSKKYTPSDF